MANTILIKQSAVANRIPNPSDLELGELAVNTTDGLIYMKKGDGTVIELTLIAPGEVGTVELATNSVTADKIATGAVDSSEIALGSITTTHIVDNAITTAKIVDNGITTAKIVNNAITSDKIVNASITNAKIAINTITADRIVDGSASGLDADLLDGLDSTAFATAAQGTKADNAIPLSQRSVANGVAPLDSGSKIPTIHLPATAISETFVEATEAGMLGLTAQTGDTCIRTDLNKTFILQTEPASTLGNWQEMLTPTDAVQSVDGRQGTVILTDRYLGITATAADSDLLNGYNSSQAATVDTIVRRTPTGQVYASYFNNAGSADTTSVPTHVFVEAGSDGYIRPQTLATFKNNFGKANDSNLLDGINSSQFLRSDISDSYGGGVLTVRNDAGALMADSTSANTIQVYQPTSNTDAFITFHIAGDYAAHLGINGVTNKLSYGGWSKGTATYPIALVGDTSQTGTIYATTFQGTASSANYADLAEKYLADDKYEPGTVVSFGGEFEVTASTTDYSRNIAGVVSTDPAYTMNAELAGDNVVTIALRGRVPCKVSGHIKKGDLLVTDGNGGARSHPDPVAGSIIGRSLEDSEGDAVIEVVVT